MPLTLELAVAWIATFALSFTVFGGQRLPSFWAEEYAKAKRPIRLGMYGYIFFPIWAIVLSANAASDAIFLQETVTDHYYAYLILTIVSVFFMHAWLWAWNFPVHPTLAAIIAFLIFGSVLAKFIVVLVAGTTNTWFWGLIWIPLAWTFVAMILSIVAAVRLHEEFYDIQRRVAEKNDRLHKMIEAGGDDETDRLTSQGRASNRPAELSVGHPSANVRRNAVVHMT